jgi:hypothetical protein
LRPLTVVAHGKLVRAGDWDLDTMKLKSGSAAYETDLSADEKTLAEVKAACMIIDERMSAYDADLSSFQTKLEGLNERMMQAERSYAVRLPDILSPHACYVFLRSNDLVHSV